MKKIILIILIIVGGYNVLKPLPDNTSFLGTIYQVPESSVTFLADRTYVDEDAVRRTDQVIFDKIFNMIDDAEHYILIDMFLLNDFQGETREETRFLSSELMNNLIEKKEVNPDIEITLITDPINTVYGGYDSEFFPVLEEVGINVVITDLIDLRDSNPLYSSVWRTFIQWFGNDTRGAIVPHPFSANSQPVTVRSYLSLFNFKANHRKVIVADNGEDSGILKMVTLITSANPHDGSSAHGNVAVVIEDSVWQDVLLTENAVIDFSEEEVKDFSRKDDVVDEEGDVKVQLLTEGKIREVLLDLLQNLKEDNTVDIAMFYLSDRKIVEALIELQKKDIKVRLLLDPNKDAFGHEKKGIPNRPVADELLKNTDGNVQIRWCDTHGEQCHSKMVIIQSEDTTSLLLGSANLTRRNIGDYNLETNILIQSKGDVSVMVDAQNFFDELWTNTESRFYSVSYEEYEDSAVWKYWLYRGMEKIGLSSF